MTVAGSAVAPALAISRSQFAAEASTAFSQHAAERVWSSTVGWPGKDLGQRLALAILSMTFKSDEKSFSGLSPPLLSGGIAYTTILAAEC